MGKIRSSRFALTTSGLVVILTIIACTGIGPASTTVGPSPTARATLTPIDVRLSFFPALTNNAGFYVALDKGYYDDEAIKLQLVHIKSGTDQLTALAAGQLDFGVVVASSVILAQEDGAPVRMIAAKQAQNPITTLSLAERSVIGPRDYEGKTFASNPGSVEFQLLPILGRLNGFDAAKVQIKQLDNAVVLSSLLAGQIDVASAFYGSLSDEWIVAARRSGKELRPVRWAEFGLDIYGDMIVASDRTIADRPDVVRRFLRATARGFADAIANPDIVPTIILKFEPTTDREVSALQWNHTVQTMTNGKFETMGYGWIDPTRLASTASIILDASKRTAKRQPGDRFTNEFLAGVTVQPGR